MLRDKSNFPVPQYSHLDSHKLFDEIAHELDLVRLKTLILREMPSVPSVD